MIIYMICIYIITQPSGEGIALIDAFLESKQGHDLAVKLDKLVALRENLNAYVARLA